MRAKQLHLKVRSKSKSETFKTMTKKENLLILNLISAFVVGFALTTFLHELAHALAAKIVKVEPIWFHSYVSYDSSSTPQMNQLYIAAAGPLFSLIQSFLFLGLLHKRTKIDYVTFLFLWMGVIGMVVFLGYMMIGPFVPYGDTGQVFAILAIPKYASLSFSAIALILIIYFFRKVTPIIGGYIYLLNTELKYTNKKATWYLFIVPLVIGTVINVLISLPAPTAISLVFPITISLTMLPSAIRLKSFILATDKKSLSNNLFAKRKYLPLTLLLLVILASRILATGIRL